ncbi:MAG: NAD(P)(+) transhydrogenase (Re/Si-specific) subunit beta [Gammaproteobacteria bacterium]
MNNITQLIYLLTTFLLLLGLKKMSSPKTATNGIILAGWGMLLAVIVTFFAPDMHGLINYELTILAMVIGSVLAWISGKKVKMIQIPQMIALYNGMGGGAACAIAILELLHSQNSSVMMRGLALIGALVGAVSFSGSIIAFAKLQDIIQREIVLPLHQFFNVVLLFLAVTLAVHLLLFTSESILILPFIIATLLLGLTFTLPIGGANMPIVISLFNAMTGLAVGFNGFVLQNPALIVAGIVVGSSGTLLTQMMAKAMNKNIFSILFSSYTTSKSQESADAAGNMKPIEIDDTAIMMAYANKVIISPGYGMAVAQAQHKISELASQLTQRGISVKFAIHPVAGRMPGHMNVLLAEAGVSYDNIFDLEEINAEFAHADVALVIGANDVVNPAAMNQPSSPIYGMPVLNVSAAKNVLVIKRGQGKGFSGVENSLFTMDNVHMLYGDGMNVVNRLIQVIKNL